MIDINELTNISYSDKKTLVSKTCSMYKKIKKSKNLLEAKIKHANLLNDSKKNHDLMNLNVMSIFDTILSLLNNDLFLIIEQDFIEVNSNPHWYLKYWSKTTYYKLKHEAINQFLFMLYA